MNFWTVFLVKNMISDSSYVFWFTNVCVGSSCEVSFSKTFESNLQRVFFKNLLVTALNTKHG